MASSDIDLLVEGASVNTSISLSAEGRQPVPELGSGGASTKSITIKKEVENIKSDLAEQKKKLSELEKRAEDVIKKAETINTRTTTVALAVIITFTLSFVTICVDYYHNNSEERKYFSELLSTYQTKESSGEQLNLFKDCLKRYGINFCANR